MDNKTIVLRAGELTRHNENVRRIALIYSGVALGVSFLLTLVNFLLGKQIDGTSGLQGMDLRTLLSTAQAVLTVLSTVALPFWDMGFYAAALDFSREKEAHPSRLLEGFYRFRRVLAFMLLQGLFLGLLAMICFYGVTMLYILSPFSDGLFVQMESVLANMDPVNPDMAVVESLLPSLLPVYALAVLAALVFVVPATYRLRLGQWYLMDKDMGGKAAIRASARAMKRQCFSLFRLDLRFWWYYLLQALALAVAYLDVLLPGLDGDVAFFVTYAVSLVLQFGLSVLVMPKVQVAYALYYSASI